MNEPVPFIPQEKRGSSEELKNNGKGTVSMENLWILNKGDQGKKSTSSKQRKNILDQGEKKELSRLEQ